MSSEWLHIWWDGPRWSLWRWWGCLAHLAFLSISWPGSRWRVWRSSRSPHPVCGTSDCVQCWGRRPQMSVPGPSSCRDFPRMSVCDSTANKLYKAQLITFWYYCFLLKDNTFVNNVIRFVNNVIRWNSSNNENFGILKQESAKDSKVRFKSKIQNLHKKM